MMEPFFLMANRYLKEVDYTHIEPRNIAKRHYEYILDAKHLNKKSESSLYTETKMILYLFNFLKQRGINDLSTFTYPILQEFYSYLETIMTKQQKPLAQSSKRLVYTFFKSFSKWLNAAYPNEAPALNIFMKSKFKRNNETLKTNIISDFVLEQIKKAVRKEDDPYVKAYLVLLLYYGLRSVDIVSLKSDCLCSSDYDGKYDLKYIDHKVKETVTIPALDTPATRAISSLIHYTHELRELSGLKSIFLKTNRLNKIKEMTAYQRELIQTFVKKHEIYNENGNLAKLTSHMFRRTLATNLQSHGASVETTQVLLNHKHKRTTMQYYIKTKDEDYLTQISDTLKHMQILTSKNDIKVTNVNFELGNPIRLSDGYCTNETMLNDENYLCDTFKKRGNCYGCSKMVTTPEFLPYFKDLYKDKEEELELKSIYGSNIVEHINFEKDVIGMLIAKLEAFGEDT